MRAEDPVGLGVGEDLDEAVGFGVAAGAGVGGERKLADPVLDAVALQLLLGAPHRRHLRPGVDHGRDRLVVHVPGLPGDQLDDGDTFLLGLVRQHLAADDVADGEDAGDVGLEVVVDLDEAALGQLDAHRLEAEPVDVWPPADGDEDDVGLQCFGLTAVARLDGEGDAGIREPRPGDLGAQAELQPLLLQDALHLLRHLAVHPRQHLVEELDDGDLGTEPPPHRAELDADVAAADDDHRLRHALQVERAGRADDAFLIHLDARKCHHLGAGGDDDVLALQHPRLAAVLRGDLDGVGAGKARRAQHVLDLVLLEQEGDALGQVVNHLVLARKHGVEVGFDAADLDAVVGELVGGRLEVMRRLQQRLRRDAADVEAGAAERRPLLDAGHPHAELRRADRGDIAARAGADDDDIVAVVAHGLPSLAPTWIGPDPSASRSPSPARRERVGVRASASSVSPAAIKCRRAG